MTSILIQEIINSITYSRFIITFQAIEPIKLPAYQGSTFRGCLGNAFRRLVCKFPSQKNCEQCSITRDCLFSYMFAMPLPHEHPAFGRFTTPPRPYILNPLSNNTVLNKCDKFGFELTLIGDSASRLTPVLPAVFTAMGEMGIGEDRGRFIPLAWLQENSKGAFEPIIDNGILNELRLSLNESFNNSPQLLKLRFDTPLRLMSSGKPATAAPEFKDLVDNLLRRTSMLANIYCGMPWAEELSADNGLGNISINAHKLAWVNWQRYSGTKNMHMKFDGHTGYIEYYGEVSNWLPLVKAGEVLHAGSTATFGLGKYTILLNE